MSLISLITNRGLPLMVSDLALSTTDDVKPVNILVLNKPYAPGDFPYEQKLYSHRLKTMIIKDLLCIGCTGLVAEIRELQNNVSDFFIHREPTADNLKEFLVEYQYFHNKGKDLSVIFILAFKTEIPYYFEIQHFGDWQEETSPIYDRSFSSGTGAKPWHDKFSLLSSMNFDNKTIYGVSAKRNALMACSHFLKEEMITPENLRDGWGGGFDIIHFENGKFKRLNDVCYAFWDLNIDDDNKWNYRIKSFIHQTYIDDVLILRNQTDKFQAYAIPKVNSPGGTMNVPNLTEYSSNLIVSCVNLYSGGVLDSRILTVIDPPQTDLEDYLFSSSLVDDFLRFKFQDWHFTELTKMIKEFIDN